MMTDDEFEEFSAAWCGASLTIGAENRLDEDAVIMAFESLKDDYSIPQVKYALNQIVRDTKHRYWLITPADIIRKIDGETPSADKFIGLARAKNTPLGIVAFTIVGGDIDRQDAYYLRQRGEELVIRYEADLKPRLLRGEYTDHELRLMIKYQVDPCAPSATPFCLRGETPGCFSASRLLRTRTNAWVTPPIVPCLRPRPNHSPRYRARPTD